MLIGVAHDISRFGRVWWRGVAVACSLAGGDQAVGAPPALAGAATLSGVSQYLFRGLRLSDGGLQPGLEITAGSGVFGVWSNWPVNGDKIPGSSDPEIDLYGAYNIALPGELTLMPGFTWYHFPQAGKYAGFYRATFEPSLALSRAAGGVRFTPRIYYDVVRKGPTYELTALYAFPLKNIGSELDFTATYGGYKWKEASGQSTPEVKAWGRYWLLGVSAPFQFTLTSRVTVGWAYTAGRRAFTKAGREGQIAHPLAASRGVLTLSYVRTF